MSHSLTTIAELESLYGRPVEAATVKGGRPDHAALPRLYRGIALRHLGDSRAGRARLLAPALRANGRAHLSIDPDLLASFAVEDKPPRAVMTIEVEAVYFQCARAGTLASLERRAAYRPQDAASDGRILAALSASRIGGEAYDREWPARAAKTMW